MRCIKILDRLKEEFKCFFLYKMCKKFKILYNYNQGHGNIHASCVNVICSISIFLLGDLEKILFLHSCTDRSRRCADKKCWLLLNRCQMPNVIKEGDVGQGHNGTHLQVGGAGDTFIRSGLVDNFLKELYVFVGAGTMPKRNTFTGWGSCAFIRWEERIFLKRTGKLCFQTT